MTMGIFHEVWTSPGCRSTFCRDLRMQFTAEDLRCPIVQGVHGWQSKTDCQTRRTPERALQCAQKGACVKIPVEATTFKHIKYIAESEAGVDSVTNIGGSAWDHRSGEERNSISQVLLTAAVTIVLAVVLHQGMRFLSHLTIVLEDDYEAMFEGQSSQPENSGDTLTQICVEGQSIYVEAGFETDLKIDIKLSRDGWDRSHTNPQTCLKIDIKQFRDDWDMGHTNPQSSSGNNNSSDTHEQNDVVTEQGACVSKPLKDLVNDPSDYLREICKRLDTPLPGVGNYKEVAKYYNFDVYTIYDFKVCPEGPSNALILAIMAKNPKVTVEMFATVVAEQASRGDVAELLRAFDRK